MLSLLILLAFSHFGGCQIDYDPIPGRFYGFTPQPNDIPFPHSGYYTVDKTNGAHLFYVLTPAENNASDAPLCLWLQGGPGGASTLGMLLENGPWLVNDQLKLVKNPYPWNAKINMLYFDQPAGSGWSYVDSPAGYIHWVEESANQLYDALLQFFDEHPEYKTVDFYVSGESYGGKWVPAISHKIFKSGGIPNFKGLLIGDGLVDPIPQFSAYASTGYFDSIFDLNQREHFETLEAECLLHIGEKNWMKAFNDWTNMVDVEFAKVSGNVNYFDIRVHEAYPLGHLALFMEQTWVKQMFNIPSGVTFNASSDIVYNNFREDIPKTVKWMLEDLLNAKFKVLLYVGQFDYVINIASVNAYVRMLDWHGRGKFNGLSRDIWMNAEGKLAGYQKQFENLKFVAVADAGHLSPMDQRQNVQEMVQDFILGK